MRTIRSAKGAESNRTHLTGVAPRTISTRAPAGSSKVRRPSQKTRPSWLPATVSTAMIEFGLGDQRPREQRVRVAGYDEQSFEVGPHDRAACGKCVSSRACRSGHENTVATEGRHRSAVDFEDNFENSQTRTILDTGLVERPPAIDDLVVHPNHNVECHTGLDAIFLANYLCESLVEMLGLGLCQKSDPSEVDAQYRNGRFLSEFGGAQKCAVTTENQN